MKKILSILLAVSLMTMSLGTVNAQIKDTAVRKDMAAKAEANTPEASQGVKSQAMINIARSKTLKELYPTTTAEKDKLSVTLDGDKKITALALSSALTEENTTLNLADLKAALDAKTAEITSLTATGNDADTLSKIKTLVIPAQIKTIASDAFTSLTGLTKIIIENNKADGPTSENGKWGSTSANLKTKYMDEMPSFTTGDIEADPAPGQAEKYGKLVAITPSTDATLKEVVSDSTETTINGKLAFDKDTLSKVVKAIDADEFVSEYTVTISDLGKPVVKEQPSEVKFTEAELATYKDTTKDAAADTKLDQFKKAILTKSAIKIVDADKPTEEITADLNDTEVKSLLTMKDGSSKELKVSATNTTTSSKLADDVKIKVTIANTTTPETPETPETPQEITLETLKAEITKAEALKEADYTSSTWNVLKAALTEAKAVVEKEKPSKEELKKAYDALVKAMDALRKPVAEGTVATESGKTVTAEEIPAGTTEFKKIEAAVADVDSSIEGADKFDVKNGKVTQVLDLTVTDADKNGETVKLKLAKVTDGKKYVLAHFDQATGKIDAIYEGVDNGDGTYSFSGIKAFSPFAVMEVTPKATTDSSNNSTSKNPSTGDTTGIAIFLTLTIASATGAYVVRKKLVK